MNTVYVCVTASPLGSFLFGDIIVAEMPLDAALADEGLQFQLQSGTLFLTENPRPSLLARIGLWFLNRMSGELKNAKSVV